MITFFSSPSHTRPSLIFVVKLISYMSEISQAARKKGILKNTSIGVISKKYVLLRKQEKKEEIKENKFIE